jgi:hypothetical protein
MTPPLKTYGWQSDAFGVTITASADRAAARSKPTPTPLPGLVSYTLTAPEQARLRHSSTAEADEPAHEAPLLARGVYCTPWFYHGRKFLFVVDHTHSVLHMEPVTDHGDRDAQVRSLQVMLSALDPYELRIV